MSTLTAYRVAPQSEFKAAAELRRHRIRAYVPRDPSKPRKTPLMHGYVSAREKPAFAWHVRSAVGDLTITDLANLYRDRRRRETNAKASRFAPGDLVRIELGPFADTIGTVDEPRAKKDGWMVKTVMFGHQCSVFVKERYLSRIRDG